MANIFTNGTYKIITAGLRAEFQKGIEETVLVSAPLYQKVPSTGAENVYSWLEHLPGMREWFKGQSRTFRNYSLRDFSVKNRKFEDSLPIQLDDIDDNQLGQLAPAMRGMTDAAKMIVDELIFGSLNYGFTNTTDPGTGTSALCYDGLSWFNTAHQVGLSTVSNYVTAKLTSTSYAAAYTAIKNFSVQPDKLSHARPLNPGGKYLLVVNPLNEMVARQILVNERNQYGATNELRGTADILSTSWVTNSNAWYLLNVGGPVKPAFLQERQPLTMVEKTPANSDLAFLYDQVIYGVKWRGAALTSFPCLATAAKANSGSCTRE